MPCCRCMLGSTLADFNASGLYPSSALSEKGAQNIKSAPAQNTLFLTILN